MPNARPRIQITPTEETYHLIVRLSKLTGKGQATLVRELLDEAAPALKMMIDAFQEIGKSPQEIRAAVGRMAAQAHQTIAQATLDLDNDRKPGRKPGNRGRGAANTG
jgi:sugar (pentulose or hexulose) kinase